MNQKELRIMEEFSNNVKTVGKNIKELNDTMKKVNNKTNKNTLMYRLIEAVENLGKELKKSD